LSQFVFVDGAVEEEGDAEDVEFEEAESVGALPLLSVFFGSSVLPLAAKRWPEGDLWSVA
jgi:hypothetical protein